MLSWLYSTQKFGIKLGLENTRRLLAAVGDPHVGLPSIHVAGTNGKGSVCAMLDACLASSGIKTGRYTSPHLLDFSERIRVAGNPIPSEAMARGLRELKHCSRSWHHAPTFFELATVLALWWFAEQQCEIAILETGMGGRLDATNVVVPLVAVLTPVAMDHAAHLGDTLKKIAAEKAGIIKSGRPVVSAVQHPVVANVIRDTARRLGSPAQFVDRPWEGLCGLAGPHQLANAALAVASLRATGLPVTEEAIRTGLANVSWPGRFHAIGQDWILDGAHNPHAAEAFAATWKEKFGAQRVPVIFGCLTDKEAREILTSLESLATSFHFVPVASERTRGPEELCSLTSLPSTPHASLAEALRAARRQSGAPPTIITGSLFLIGQALEVLAVNPGVCGFDRTRDA